MPTETDGGMDLVSELIRGPFDAGMVIRAAQAMGGLFCWPSPAAQQGRHSS